MAKTVQVETVAEAYLELLAARGVDYFFGNGGTDFAPIVEAYAKRFTQEQMLPKPIPVPHEITAVAMAHGYTMVTGRPQVVMVHTIPALRTPPAASSTQSLQHTHAFHRGTNTPH